METNGQRAIRGLHHVTAIAGDPQRNLDFYAGLLGLRLVKRTVNFDDPVTYHLYYGDEVGHPGSILTFFPWPDALRGRAGEGMAVAAAFSVPESSLDYWMGRFADEAYDFGGLQKRFGRPVLSFEDPDGLRLELVREAGAAEMPGWEGGPVPAEHALRSFHSVTLCVKDVEPTARLLTDTFGYAFAGEEKGRFRFREPGGGPAGVVDLHGPLERELPRMGGGTVHHVAFRARDEEEQRTWRQEIAALGFDVTPVVDRQYFHSIYFREPGGVLFEIATDPPGFTVDEAPEELGTHLQLPPWLEPQRRRLEQRLPRLQVPTAASSRNAS